LPGVAPEGFQAFFVGRRGKLSSKGYWSPEQVEQLRSLLSQGLPFAKIALQMGASRNAVIGKAHRLGLKSTSAGGRLRGAAAPESAEVAGARPWETDSVPGSQAVIKYYAGKAGPKAVPAAASLPPAALTASPGLRRNYDRLERNRAQRVKRNEAERLRLQKQRVLDDRRRAREREREERQRRRDEEARETARLRREQQEVLWREERERQRKAHEAAQIAAAKGSAQGGLSGAGATAAGAVRRPPRGIRIVDLTDTTCRWPIGDPCDSEMFRFCGRKTVERKPYCAKHSEIAYTPANARRPRDRADSTEK